MDEHNVYLRPPVWLPIFVAVLVGGAYIAGQVIAADDEEYATITVSGEGKVFIAPDIAEVSFGIQTGREPTAAAAMAKLKTGMEAIVAAVEKTGIEEKDIRTENFWLNPIYDYTERGQVFRGFEANQSLRVKVREIDKASDVLGAATSAGANQAGNIQFTVDDPEAKRAEAREKAIEQAQEKAKTLAKSLGMELDDLVGFSEGGGGYPPVMMMRGQTMNAEASMDSAAAGVPLPAGEQEIVVSVSLTYELE